MERNRGGRPRHPDVLTPAEWRVLEALREGGTNAEIGARLGTSADAVKYHVSNMLGKLELRDRHALAAWRPEERRGRLPAWFAVPAALAYVARPLVWVGLGTAAAVGVTVTVLAAVVAVAVLLVVVGGDGDAPAVALPPAAAPDATSTPTPMPTVEPAPTTATPRATPTASPAATVSPGPTAAPTLTATPTPEPCISAECVEVNECRGVECMEADPDPHPCFGYDCIEAVPNAFERRIFEPGEHIDWDEGVFFLDVTTGRTDAYRVEGVPEGQFFSHDGAWITVVIGRDWDLVLHRASGRAWRWAEGTEDRLLAFLRDELQLDYPDCVTYPDPRPPLGQAGWYGVTCDESPDETGTSAPACQGRISPDGQYVAQQWGQPDWVKYRQEYRPLHAVPSVVIADARTCAPLYRVVGAYAYQQFWEGQWLSNSEGFVVGVMDGFAVARVHPAELVYLPPLPTMRDSVDPWANPWPTGPVPAPTGDGRYFAYGFAGVYDAGTDRWTLTGFDDAHWGPFSWGETHEEMRYELGYWGEGWFGWNLTEPRIEFPPFEEIAFRIAATDSCLDLRDKPNSMATVLDCVPDGTRVIAAMPQLDEASCLGRYTMGTCLPMTRVEDGALGWVYVRVESGVSGWVAHSRVAIGEGGDIEVQLLLRPAQPSEGGPASE